MTLSEFLEQLPLTHKLGKWAQGERLMRLFDDDPETFVMCPITSVHKLLNPSTTRFDVQEYDLAGDQLQLPSAVCEVIVTAADGGCSSAAIGETCERCQRLNIEHGCTGLRQSMEQRLGY